MIQFAIILLDELLPVVVMHGVSQGKEGTEDISRWVRESIQNVEAINCEVGNGGKDSIFMNMRD